MEKKIRCDDVRDRETERDSCSPAQSLRWPEKRLRSKRSRCVVGIPFFFPSVFSTVRISSLLETDQISNVRSAKAQKKSLYEWPTDQSLRACNLLSSPSFPPFMANAFRQRDTDRGLHAFVKGIASVSQKLVATGFGSNSLNHLREKLCLALQLVGFGSSLGSIGERISVSDGQGEAQ